MTRSAPRIDERLVAAIARLDERGLQIAETNRVVGDVAAQLGLQRPSYEQVRTIVHGLRNRPRSYGLRDAAVEISFRTADPQVVLSRLIDRPPLPKRK